MTRPRFYAPDASRPGLTVSLPTDEAHQLRRVLRLGRGAPVQLFDGRGHEFVGQVERVDRTTVTIRTLDPVPSAPEPRVHLTLAAAILKGRALDKVVRDATMLGAAEIRPMTTVRSHIGSAPSDHVVRRWRAIAISSAKQCRRAVVPTVHEVAALEAVMSETRSDLTLLLVEPVHNVAHESIAALAGRDAPASATVAIGPEGGWSDEEVRAAVAAGFVPLTLGSRTLRADAAPAAAIAVLQHVWGDL